MDSVDTTRRVLEALAKAIEEKPEPKMVNAYKSILDAIVIPEMLARMQNRIDEIEEQLIHLRSRPIEEPMNVQ